MVNSPLHTVEHGTHYPNRIFIGSLPGSANASDLAEFFKDFGTVLEGKVVLDINGNSRRFGFVTFATSDDVQKVLNQRPIFFKGKQVNVGPAVKRVAEHNINMGYASQQVSVPASAPHSSPPPLHQIEYASETPSPPTSPMALPVRWRNVFLDTCQISPKAMLPSVHLSPRPPLYIISCNGMPINANCTNVHVPCQNMSLSPTFPMIPRNGKIRLNHPLYVDCHNNTIKCFTN